MEDHLLLTYTTDKEMVVPFFVDFNDLMWCKSILEMKNDLNKTKNVNESLINIHFLQNSFCSNKLKPFNRNPLSINLV